MLPRVERNVTGRRERGASMADQRGAQGIDALTRHGRQTKRGFVLYRRIGTITLRSNLPYNAVTWSSTFRPQP